MGCHRPTLQDTVLRPSLTIRYFSCPRTRTVLMVCMGYFSRGSPASCVDSGKSSWPQSSLWHPSCPLEFPGGGWDLHNPHPEAVAEECLQEG